jgi:hypothetical protein
MNVSLQFCPFERFPLPVISSVARNLGARVRISQSLLSFEMTKKGCSHEMTQWVGLDIGWLPDSTRGMPSPPAPLPLGEGRMPSPPAPLPQGEGRMPSPPAPLPQGEGSLCCHFERSEKS